MKYNFKPYTTILSEKDFHLPKEVLDDLKGIEIYILKHPDGWVIIGDSDYMEKLFANDVIQNADNNHKMRLQRLILSRTIISDNVDDVVSCLTSKIIGFNLGDTVTVESGDYSIVLKQKNTAQK